MTTFLTPGPVTISAPGLAPKLPNDNTKFLDGTGAYSTPAGGGTAAAGIVIEELDGTPLGTATVLVVPNGSLAISGGTATLTFSGGTPDSGLQGAIEAYNPVLYFKCDEGSGATYLMDYLNRFRMGKQGSPVPGEPAIADGSLGSTRVTGSGAWSMGPVAMYPEWTIGMVWKENSSGSDEAWWGAWDGNGAMFGYTSGISLYAPGSITTGQSISGTHLWIGTLTGTTATLYKDGTSIATSAGASFSYTAQTWGINWYSNGTRAADGWASDCFYIPQCLDATEVANLAAEFTAI